MELEKYQSLSGKVIAGSGRKEMLKVPTANLRFRSCKVENGVYASLVRFEKNIYRGVAHLGPIPTFGGADPVIEVHLIEFDKMIKGRWLTVYFIKKIRGVKKFSSAGELCREIRRDILKAKAILSKLK